MEERCRVSTDVETESSLNPVMRATESKLTSLGIKCIFAEGAVRVDSNNSSSPVNTGQSHQVFLRVRRDI